MARKKGSKDYPREIKRLALQLYLEESWSYAAITETLGIRDPGRVKAWVSQYRREGEAFFSHRRSGRPRQPLRSLEEAQMVIEDYIFFYNYERIQLKTKLTPAEVRGQSL